MIAQIYLITRMLNEGKISERKANEMTEVAIEKEYSFKTDKYFPSKVLSY